MFRAPLVMADGGIGALILLAQGASVRQYIGGL